MARPTKEQQEKKRIAGLLAEGKGPDGQLLVRAKRGRPSKNPSKELGVAVLVPFEEYDVFLKNGATRLPKAIKDLIDLRYNHNKNYTFPGSEAFRYKRGNKGGKYLIAFNDHMQFSKNVIRDMIEKWPRKPIEPIAQPILRLENIPAGYIDPRFEYEKLLKGCDKFIREDDLPSEIRNAIRSLKAFLKNTKNHSSKYLLKKMKNADLRISQMINDWLLTTRLQNIGISVSELEGEIENSTMDNNAGNNDSTKHDRFREPIIENSYGNPEPELDDLSPTEKLKQVEMFADAILETYGELYLLAFTELCSVKMNKMEVLDRNGIIRLSMVIVKGESGDLTVSEFFVEHNEKTKVLFTISPEMKAELREPLIAVLMEKGVAPTPMVRLLITAGRHILMGVFSAAQLKAEIKEALQSFKEFREQEIEKEEGKGKDVSKPTEREPDTTPTSYWNKKYIAQTTIRDRDTRYTIVQGEECKLQSIDIYKETKMAVLINSQQNKFDVPYDIFTSFFIPSEQ